MRFVQFRLVLSIVIIVTARLAGAEEFPDQALSFRVMTFNILQGGGEAKNVGFDNSHFGGSRFDELAAVIKLAKADVVGVQEDTASDKLLMELGPGWQRVGSIYSRLAMTKVSVQPYLTIVRVRLSEQLEATVVNCHWTPPAKGYGPDVLQSQLLKNPKSSLADLARLAEKACAVPDGARGYKSTLSAIENAQKATPWVLLTGDFNEPSHLDWTENYQKHGADRWVKNPTPTPLTFPVAWPGSTLLAEAGIIDSYRAVYTDEVKKPGWTWTPQYPVNTAGRRPFADQCLDRIDRIYHSGETIEAVSASVVGEKSPSTDIIYEGPWPSDHRAVVVEFRRVTKGKASSQ